MRRPRGRGADGSDQRAINKSRGGSRGSRAAGRRAESSRDRMGSCARECTSFRRRAPPESRKSRHSRHETRPEKRRRAKEARETALRPAPRRAESPESPDSRMLAAIINIDARTLGNPLSARCDSGILFGARRSAPLHDSSVFALSARNYY